MGRQRKEIAAEASFSLERSEASQQSADSGNIGANHSAGSAPFSIWSEPFNVSNESPFVHAELMRRAPFLQGSDRARYTEGFFTEIGGLCGEGIPFKKLKEDHGVSLESLLKIYPSNRSHNRHPTRHMSASGAAEALRMYQRVYGGSQPDNCEFGTAFLRGLRLQAKKKKVNWAKGAAELAEVRVKNAVNNPGKLTPPCLREQIQSVLDLTMGLISRAVAANSAALSQLKQAQIHVCPEAQLTIDIATAPKQSSKMVIDRRVFKSVPIHIRALAKQPRSSKSKSPAVKDEKASCGSLLKRQASCEDMLIESLHQQEMAEDELARLQQQRKDIAREEEGHWDKFAAIQRSKKEREMNESERAVVDSLLRVTMAAASASTDALSANASEVDKCTNRVEKLASQTIKLQDLVGELTGQIHVLLIEESCIRPQQFFTAFPKEPLQMVPLRIEMPCVLCGRYWAEMALVNLPCGCLLHPCCMFKIALYDAPKCPSCDHAVGGVWMGQWGFATNNASMEASIAAWVAAMEEDGWAPPLGCTETLAKVKKMLLGVAAAKQEEWSVLKRAPERAVLHHNSDIETTHLPKRTCVGPKTSAFLDTGVTVVHASTKQGSVTVGPPILQDLTPSNSNQHRNQHVSNKKDTSGPGETPSSSTSCNNNLLELDVETNHDTEVLAIAHAAVAETLALNAGFQLDVL